MKENRKITEQVVTGTSLTNWLALLFENRFHISWRYLPRAFLVTLMTFLTFPLVLYERIRYGRKIKKTAIKSPLIIIIGHWRSGTTFLQSLMIQDKQFAYISQYQALMPHIYLCGDKLVKRILKRYMPKTRRMDNVPMGVYEPQDEEYAMINLSRYTFYLSLMFPRRIRHYARFNTLDTLSEKAFKKWKKIYLDFLKKIAYCSGGKRLLLKNPSNTCRIKILLEMFPNVKFIHLYRNPFDVFPSTLLLHEKLSPYTLLQRPYSPKKRNEIIFDVYQEMYEKFFAEKEFIPVDNLIEIRYEDFIQDPYIHLQKIYKKFNFSDFEKNTENFKSYLITQQNFKINIHNIDDNLKQEIANRWQFTINKWGYG
ncbi:MAG: sulfotransferase [Candidatus Heimdallarchaeota archaeon]